MAKPSRTSNQLRRRRSGRQDHSRCFGIESDDVANYCFPKNWPEDHERRARIIGDWLRAEARFLA
jgi:hypothetical protein